MTPTLTDFWIVALTVMAEAEGEPYKGKVAVAAVIYNRARNPAWWGTTIADACLTSKQFSAWNDDNKRRNKIGEWGLDNKTFRDCFKAAVEAFDRDPTDGADHYYVTHMRNPPSWAAGRAGVQLGSHTFLKLGAQQ